jgi:hypothetical protein
MYKAVCLVSLLLLSLTPASPVKANGDAFSLQGMIEGMRLCVITTREVNSSTGSGSLSTESLLPSSVLKRTDINFVLNDKRARYAVHQDPNTGSLRVRWTAADKTTVKTTVNLVCLPYTL